MNIARLALTLAAALTLASCSSDPRSGYAHTTTFDSSIETIAVPVFDNTTYSQGLEATLTEAIIKEVHRTTPWRVVTRERAQTLLTGSITGWSLEKITTNSQSGLVEELGAQVTVSFEWRDARTGEVLVARRNFRSTEPFVPAQGAQERLDVGERSAIDRLARELVSQLRASAW